MALITRVSQLFRADFNAVLDQIEEPEQILKQAIRDMEEELSRSENRISVCTHEQETLTGHKDQVNDSIKQIDSELDLCFQSGKEDLARGLVRRKLQANRQIRNLEAQIQANDRYLQRERQLFDENRETLDALRQKAELFLSRPQQDQHGAESQAAGFQASAISEEEVEIALLREKSSRSGS